MRATNANVKLRKSRQLPPETARNALVIDAGGTHIKVYPKTCATLRGRYDSPASHHRMSMAHVGKQIKEGRHVGLDFYDLLIEALMRAEARSIAGFWRRG